MQSFTLVLKGFIVGLGKIIPGVSGSLLALSLGIYEKAIDCITNFFHDLKANILFLGKISLGALISILLFSNLIIHLLDKYYLYTVILFIGLICGTIPYIFKKVTISKKSNIIYIFLALILIFFLNFFKSNNTFTPQNNMINIIYIIFIGFLDAFTMIVPGISGTATFMMLGCYNFVLNIFSNPFRQLSYTILFGFGLILGVFLTSKLINYLLIKHKEELYLSIIGFSLSSILYLFLKLIPLFNFYNLIISLFLLIIGFLISYKLGKL